jgi:hypothetical protein
VPDKSIDTRMLQYHMPVAKIKPLLLSCILSDAYTSGPFLNTFLQAATTYRVGA